MEQREKKKILIVDDEEDIRTGLDELLSGEGYEVHCSSNGREAIEWLKTSDQTPNVILLDLMMPVMDGRSFKKAQEQLPSPISTSPVIVISADASADKKAKDIGAIGCLRKPFDIDVVINTIKRVA